ncbi:hypothetical protein VMF7928_00512 [Vibrio marisflavi CECT 7928]|uniref:Uncharacterized protein n=1 Tax=Vibrio marisflavi CECT 7928 TaxID=634439 RepID=A0ABM8ZZY9_9VIBR|nr:hypothetical protein VMF7928_00512 [Vibrio marisflavi CECT 7928]
MSCCNKPPRGGTLNMGLFVKTLAITALVVLVLAYLFG